VYSKELAAIRRAGRFREPIMADPEAIDMASNDYLGLAHKKRLLKRACERVGRYPWHAPKASLFVGGYHPVHRDFEAALRKAHGFEAATVFGSGFLANLGLIEALVRRGDVLFIDESYHASGMVATQLVQGEVVRFRHNDMEDLLEKLAETPVKGRRIVAVEGVYSMEGDMVPREVFAIAGWFDALLVVDEAHSVGTVGPRLLGVFDHYGIAPAPNHVKMGTLGKALGSYGAYVLANAEVTDYLRNRAKSLIYATAPSLLDIALAHEGLAYMLKKSAKLRKRIGKLKDVAEAATGRRPDALIVPVPVPDNATALRIRDTLAAEGYEVGAIRPPTVASPMLRIILRTSVKPKRYRRLFARVSELLGG
jgi:8-amino-7-oxononanoate synthase